MSEEPAENEDPIVEGNRVTVTNYYVKCNIDEKAYKFHDFVRLNGIKKKFTKVNFEHCTFDSAYFKNCVFDSCTFTGCRFVSCNFHQSSFTGCDFRYATFERTFIDQEVLDREAPLEENLRMHFARSLRMNFQQIGDARAVNKAISLELRTTTVYLFKSWASSEAYYYDKYTGLKRLSQLLKWMEFKALDFIWGNGESILKLLRSILILTVLICIHNTATYDNWDSLSDYYNNFIPALANFFGYNFPENYPAWLISVISASKLIFFALFTAILVKRFSRR